MKKQRPRNSDGTFKEDPEALTKKSIGLRIRKKKMPKLERAAKQRGKSITEMCRLIIEEWLDSLESEDEQKKPVVSEGKVISLMGDPHSNQANEPPPSKDTSVKSHKQRALELHQHGLNHKEIAEKLESEGYRNRKNNSYSASSIHQWIKDSS